MEESPSHRRYPIILLGLYLLVWLWAAIAPLDRADWLLENYLVFLFLPTVIWTYYRFRLSNVSYTLLFIFFCLHSVGSHYTYAEVPFGFWLQSVFDLSRNHFDRIVHFSYGFLLSYPIREIFLRVASTRGVWGYWFPIELTLAFSAIYEVIEWLAAVVVSPETGIAFLGAQGDPWDAQKDMGLAGLGSVIAMAVTGLIRWRYDKRFVQDIEKSVTVKGKEPLGEVALDRLSRRNRTSPSAPASRKTRAPPLT